MLEMMNQFLQLNYLISLMLNIIRHKKDQILVILKNQKLSHTLKSQYQIEIILGVMKKDQYYF